METHDPRANYPLRVVTRSTVRDLVGREAEISFLSQMRQRLVGESTGCAVLFEGPAGVGKTALLEVAAEDAEAAGIRVLQVSGVESEVTLAYSGLHQLLYDLRDSFAVLSELHRKVLHQILGAGQNGTPSERFAVSVAALEALREVAAHRPVMVLVDDVQWIDSSSADVLGFVARRLRGIQVDLVAVSRDGYAHSFDYQGLVRHRIEALDVRSSSALLLRAHPGLAASTFDRLLQEAAGIPLALLELPALLSQDQREGRDALPSSLPMDDRLEALFAPRLRELPSESMELLLVAALEATGSLRSIWAAFSGGWSGADTALGPAEDMGLVRVEERTGKLRFRHPLVRSAVVRAAPPGQRRAAHRALAKVLNGEPERRIGHLLAASVGPDDALAMELEAAGHAAFRRGSAAAATDALRRAAELSPLPEERDRRLAHAAFAAVQSGAMDLTSALVDADYWEHASPEDAARAATARVYRLMEMYGDMESAHRLLVTVIDGLLDRRKHQDQAGDSSAELVGELQFLLALVSFYAQRSDMWDEVMLRADNAPEHVRLCYTGLACQIDRAVEVRQRIRQAFAVLPPDVGPRRISQLSIVSIYYDEASEYRDWWLRIAQRSQAGGTFVHWSYGTILLGHEAFFSGRWAEAETLARDGQALAEELGYRLTALRLTSQLALVSAARGDEEAVMAITQELLEWGTTRRIGLLQVSAWQAQALLALGQQDWETAYQCLERVSPPGTIPLLNPRAIWSVYDLVEAAVRTGRIPQARDHLAMAERGGLAELSPRLGMLVRAAGALVASGESAGEAFRAALAIAQRCQAPFDVARVRLNFAEWLRSEGDSAASHRELVAALDLFEELGADVWVNRVRAALSEMSERPVAEQRADSGLLTRQERQIAELAATGLSNKEIGSQLFLSPRTVSTHLYNVFPKLGIRSRAALRDALHALDREEA